MSYYTPQRAPRVGGVITETLIPRVVARFFAPRPGADGKPISVWPWIAGGAVAAGGIFLLFGRFRRE